MALTAITTYPGRRQVQVQWTGLANAQTGGSASVARWADRTIQASGTFGAGGAVAVQGSMDGSTWGAVHDPSGVAIVLTDGVPRLISENTMYIRPVVTGDGTTALGVILLGTK